MFQSSPSTAAGCCSIDRLDLAARMNVSILTQHSGWVLRLGGAVSSLHLDVSILTQHSGWVLLGTLAVGVLADLFQSSPSTAAGCCLWPHHRSGPHPTFNPHPAQRLGAAEVGVPSQCLNHVSILTQHSGWVLRLLHPAAAQRMGFNPHPAQRLGAASGADQIPAKPELFQSSPSTAAGCCGRCRCGAAGGRSFNPHPAQRLGAASTTL